MKKNKPTKKADSGRGQRPELSGRGRLTDRELVIAMIRDDLVNHRLLTGLYDLGLVTELYFLNMSQTVFDYMGISSKTENDRNYERYIQLKEEVMQFDLSEGREELNALAEKIYGELVTMKFTQQE
jgi:hypothetical protein